MTTLSHHVFGKHPVDQGASSGEDASISLIYAFLPPMVRRFMPKVRSLRPSFSHYRPYSVHSSGSTIDSTDSGTRTPPPAYHETTPRPLPLTSVLTDDESAILDLPSCAVTFSDDEQSGIQWKYARQGLRLFTLSAQESSSLSSDPAFTRQLYIDSATYLLRGLPENLTEQELISLRAATPNILFRSSMPVGRLIPRGDEQDVQDVHRTPQDYEPTVLHRVVSTVVFHFFMILSFLWPYLQVIVRNAYQYEQDHHVSKRFASQTWSTANAIGKRTVSTANMVCTWNDGQVGETLESLVTWWIQGVAGGLCEGMGEGMEALGVNPSMSPRRQEVAGRKQRA